MIEYLNQQESVHQFMASVMSLVDASVSNYQQRGFKHLMLSFGCTGGQHRSVYLGRAGRKTAARAARGGGRGYAPRVGAHGGGITAGAEGCAMKAMILAAGLGTRLRPLTNDRPKALVEVGGHTLLEITLRRLASFEIREVIINVHHFADMVIGFLQKNDNFGMRIEISREEEVLLDTGGGLKKAGWFFQNDSEPFVLHNVDVISTTDLRRMVQFHERISARQPCGAGQEYFAVSSL